MKTIGTIFKGSLVEKNKSTQKIFVFKPNLGDEIIITKSLVLFIKRLRRNLGTTNDIVFDYENPPKDTVHRGRKKITDCDVITDGQQAIIELCFFDFAEEV